MLWVGIPLDILSPDDFHMVSTDTDSNFDFTKYF
jgi:hypothetical protein